MKIHVTNLSPDLTKEELQRAFEAFGTVAFVEISQDKGKSTRSAVVEMPDEDQAWTAIESLKGRNLKGRPLKVVRPKGHASQETKGPRRHAGDREGGARGGRRS